MSAGAAAVLMLTACGTTETAAPSLDLTAKPVSADMKSHGSGRWEMHHLIAATQTAIDRRISRLERRVEALESAEPEVVAPATEDAPPAATETEPAPTIAAAAGPADARGLNAAPSGDLPGWDLLLSEDFTKDAALGQFASTYPGWADYDTWEDTSRESRIGRPEGQRGVYSSDVVASVQDGVLNKHIHTDDQGVPRVMALTPPLAGGTYTTGQTYGRYSVRFRSDSIPGYKMAWLLWPNTDEGAGEIDFPEGDLGDTSYGYSHTVTGQGEENAFYVDTEQSSTDWHVATIEWRPESLTFALDGKTWTTTDPNALPHDPMHWVLQTETHLETAAPDAASSGDVQIDWVSAWSYAG